VKAITFSGTEKTYQAWNGVPGDMLETDRRFNPSGMYFDDDGNMKFYENETDNYQQDHYQLHFTHEFNPSLIANSSLHYTYGRGYYEQYREDESFQDYGLEDVTIESTLFTETDLIRRRWLDNHFYGITYSLKYNTFNRFDMTFGGGFNIYEGDHFGEIIWAALAQNIEKDQRFYDNDAQKSDFNNFIKINYQLSEGLFLFTDLQYRNIIYDFTGLALVDNEVSSLDQRAVFHFFNPKAGLLYKFGKAHEAYGFAGISNREPVRRDFTESSPESRPTHETLYNVEAGYRYQSSNTRVGVNVYLMDYDNQLILTGEINDVGGFSRANIKDSYRMGIEFEGSVNITEKLDWTANLAFSRNKIPTFTEYSDVYDEDWNWMGSQEETYKNTDIAFSPSVVSGSHFRYTPLEDLHINLYSKYVGDQFIDNTMSNDRKLDAYLVNDLGFSYEINNSFLNRLEFTFLINNILDVEYITNAWIYKGYLGSEGLVSIEDGYFPQAGRHYLAGMRLRF
ncbi:MAG: TonB-dependent receptor domain-containing protein, partial [Bacteroidota bacterium]